MLKSHDGMIRLPAAFRKRIFQERAPLLRLHRRYRHRVNLCFPSRTVPCRSFLLFIAILFGPLVAMSQTYSFQYYSAADGLRSSGVITVFQDSRGFLWFGGIGGAFRYDGERFIPYLTSGFERSEVHEFAEDRNGTIWAATFGHGLAKIRYGEKDSVQWISTRQMPAFNDSVHSVVSDHVGNMWIGTRQGVFVFWLDGTSTHLTTNDGLYSNWVRTMRVDAEGRVWVATTDGVTRYSIVGTTIRFHERISTVPARTMTLRKDGAMILGTYEGKDEEGKGIFIFQGGTLHRIVHYDDFSDPIKTLSLLEDSKGILWIGTTRGCILWDGHVYKRIRYSHGLVSEGIPAIYEDREGSIWIASGTSVLKLPPRYTLNYTGLHGPAASVVLALLIDRTNRVWFGSFSGLYLIGPDGTTHGFGDPRAGFYAQVFALSQDKDGSLFIGTERGLWTYRDKKFSLANLSVGSSSVAISAIATDEHDGVWVAPIGRVLRLHHGIVVQSFDSSDGIPRTQVIALHVDHRGLVWFGTDGAGAGMIDHNVVSRFSVQDGLPSPEVDRITEDSRGRIWLMTSAGVVFWKDGAFHRMAMDQFPFEQLRVNTVYEDKSRHLWFGTESGVYESSDSILTHYDSRDGFPEVSITAIAEDTAGNLWFGTAAGVTKFPRPERRVSIPVPKIGVERISDEAKRTILTSRTRVPYEERSVTFQFISNSYFNERNMEFQYMLNDIESDWEPVTRRRIARYTTLPAGEYTLHVRGRNHNGSWSSPVTYSFEVLPPLWETLWFRVSVGLLLSALLFALYRYRISRLLEMERLRLRIAGDLHDEIGSSLGGIALESELIQRKLPVSDEVRFRLRKIAAESRQTAEAMRDIVWMINPEHDSMDVLVKKMQEVAVRMFGHLPHTMTVPSTEIRETLDLELKRNLFLIYKETLHNIVKHARATHVDISIEYREEHLKLRVRDDGAGFDEHLVRHGNGLRSIRDRAARMGAHLLLQSAPGTGTLVELTVRL
jgi:ligand-binding sensor domain-containing protein/two-component sensor histidine kinase